MANSNPLIIGSGQIAWGVASATGADQSASQTKTSDKAELRDREGKIVAVCFYNIHTTGSYTVALQANAGGTLEVGGSFNGEIITEVVKNEGNEEFTTYTVTTDYGGLGLS